MDKPPIGSVLRNDGHWSVRGLVGCWLFNEGGGKIANNLTGVSSGGVVGSASTFTTNGIKFTTDGSNNNYASIAATPALALTVYTVIVKITFNGNTSNNYIWARYHGAGYTGLNQAYNAGGMGEYRYGGQSLGVAPVIGVAYTIAIVQKLGSGQPFSSYINKQLILDNSLWGAAPTTETGVWTFGNLSTSAYKSVPITQEYALVYNRVLSAQEIASLHDNPYQMVQTRPNSSSIITPTTFYGSTRRR